MRLRMVYSVMVDYYAMRASPTRMGASMAAPSRVQASVQGHRAGVGRWGRVRRALAAGCPACHCC